MKVNTTLSHSGQKNNKGCVASGILETKRVASEYIRKLLPSNITDCFSER